MKDWALDYALNDLPVFPLRPGGKEPAIPNTHREGDPLRGVCKGECGHLGHGLFDATIDPDRIDKFWSINPNYNIGIRPPVGYVVLDIDVRHDGVNNLIELIGGRKMPKSAMVHTGGGGWHIWLKAFGPFKGQLCTGVDLKSNSGYVVAPPSLHPSGQRYRWTRVGDRAYAPAWMVPLLHPPVQKPVIDMPTKPIGRFEGESIADEFCEKTTWADVLVPHGWSSPSAFPDSDGAKWLHPKATSDCSATVRNNCLFVYSPNTPFKPTAAGDTNGYTKFKAFAVLNYGGDMKAAAKALAGKRSARGDH